MSAPIIERARAYLAQLPPAISGSGGHAATFRAALLLVRGFGLEEEDALRLLDEDYNLRCDPPWSEDDLRHKVEDAGKADQVPMGYLLGKSNRQRTNGPTKANTPATYSVEAGCLHRNAEKLTNFTARIDEEVLVVGVGEAVRSYRISGSLADGTVLPTVTVPVGDFAKMEWVSQRWGARTIIEPGRTAADKTRAAIQTLSSPTTRTIYTGYGWRQIGDRNVYLLPGPHVPDGVEIEHEASSYTLDGDGSIVDAYRAALDLLQIAPMDVTVPLIGAAFIAPFSTALELDFGLWMSGRSGTRKSSVAALVLSFFGKFTLGNLPLNFQATPTFLEARLHELKDLLVCIDNYIPPQTGRDAQDQTSKAVRVIQAIGDRSSRGRCRRDASMQPRRDPQGLVVFTGERLPAENESTLGRLLFVTLGEDTINLERLSDLQLRAELLRVAMRHMIQSAAERYESIVTGLKERKGQLLVEFSEKLIGVHGRTPGALASVMAGYEVMLGIAHEAGACSEEETDRLRQQGFESLIRLGLGQPKAETLGPADFYIRTIRAMVSQGSRILVEQDAPLNTTKTIGEHDVEVRNAIGWRCGDEVCLLPALAWQAVVEFHRGTVPYTQTDVHRGLAEQKLLLDRDEEGAGRFTVRRPVGGGRERVLVLARHLIEEPDDPRTPNLVLESDGKKVGRAVFDAKRKQVLVFTPGLADVPADLVRVLWCRAKGSAKKDNLGAFVRDPATGADAVWRDAVPFDMMDAVEVSEEKDVRVAEPSRVVARASFQ